MDYGGILCFGMVIHGPNEDTVTYDRNDAVMQPLRSINFKKIIQKINAITNKNIQYYEIPYDEIIEEDHNIFENYMNIANYINNIYDDVLLERAISWYENGESHICYYLTFTNIPVKIDELKYFFENIDLTNYRKVIEFLGLKYEDPIMFAV